MIINGDDSLKNDDDGQGVSSPLEESASEALPPASVRHTRSWSVQLTFRLEPLLFSPVFLPDYWQYSPSKGLSFLLPHGVWSSTQMNSLTYISRQFDVLASPRTPPSTPTSETAPLLDDGDAGQDSALKRVSTWSTRSFLIPEPPQDPSSSSSWALKRSFSSPVDVHTLTIPAPASPMHIDHQPGTSSSSSSSSPAPSRRSSRPPSRRPSVSSADPAIRPKATPESILRRIYFVRIILLLWNAIYSAWKSLTRQTPDAVVEEPTDEEKDTEDESKGEKHVSLEPPHSPFHSQGPGPGIPIPSPSSLDGSPSLASPFVNPALTELRIVEETKVEVTSVSTTIVGPSISESVQPAVSRSSTPTPVPSAHKTPFHLPKTLVLDLDETLIHSTSRPMSAGSGGSGLLGFGRRNKGGHEVEVILGGRSTLYHVYKRPFTDYFLRKVSNIWMRSFRHVSN